MNLQKKSKLRYQKKSVIDVSVEEPEKVIEKDTPDKELDSAIPQDRMEAGYANTIS